MSSPAEEKTWKVVTTHLRHPLKEEPDGSSPCPLYILNPHLIHLPFKKRFSFFDCNCEHNRTNNVFVTPFEKKLKIIIKTISSKSSSSPLALSSSTLSSLSSASSQLSSGRSTTETRTTSSPPSPDDEKEDPDYIIVSSDHDDNDDKVYTYSTPRSKRKRQYRARKKRKLFQ
jgi:hypothetical protein